MPSGGSHPRYANAVRDLIESQLCCGVPQQDIARKLRVSESWVSSLRSNFDCYGTVTPPPPGVQGRPRKIHQEAEDGIRDFLEEYETAQLDEICDFLSDEYDITTSCSSVSRCLARLQLSRKAGQRVHTEQDPVLRASYLTRMTEYSAEQLVFVDESAANERTKDRKYGWSPKGMPCRVKLPGKRSKRWSILPAIGISGYLDWEIYHGSFNTERFNLFIEQLLTKMTAFPGPRSVLVLDNARVHHSQRLREICEAVGVRIEYLPPYSPDLNPIELSFSELKSWMKNHRQLAYEFGMWYEGFITLALRSICGGDAVKGYFRCAGIEVPNTLIDEDYSEL